MEIRKINKNEGKAFFQCLKAIDCETKYMMFEPDERQYNDDIISRMIESEYYYLLGVYDGENIVGFISAQRGNYRRNKHTAYIVMGIREKYRRKGIGARLFDMLDEWAKTNKIKRLELTVEVENIAALRLYENKGYLIEGLKKSTMLVDGKFVDEYMMAKFFK